MKPHSLAPMRSEDAARLGMQQLPLYFDPSNALFVEREAELEARIQERVGQKIRSRMEIERQTWDKHFEQKLLQELKASEDALSRNMQDKLKGEVESHLAEKEATIATVLRRAADDIRSTTAASSRSRSEVNRRRSFQTDHSFADTYKREDPDIRVRVIGSGDAPGNREHSHGYRERPDQAHDRISIKVVGSEATPPKDEGSRRGGGSSYEGYSRNGFTHREDRRQSQYDSHSCPPYQYSASNTDRRHHGSHQSHQDAESRREYHHQRHSREENYNQRRSREENQYQRNSREESRHRAESAERISLPESSKTHGSSALLIQVDQQGRLKSSELQSNNASATEFRMSSQERKSQQHVQFNSQVSAKTNDSWRGYFFRRYFADCKYLREAKKKVSHDGVAFWRKRGEQQVHEFRVLKWGEVVYACDLGDGWLAVEDNMDEVLFLPKAISDIQVITCADDERILNEGYLMKLSPIEEKGWAERWCVVKDGAFEVCSIQDRKRASAISLGSEFWAKPLAHCGKRSLVDAHLPEHPYAFVVGNVLQKRSSPLRLYMFDARSPEAMDTWITAVNRASGMNPEILKISESSVWRLQVPEKSPKTHAWHDVVHVPSTSTAASSRKISLVPKTEDAITRQNLQNRRMRDADFVVVAAQGASVYEDPANISKAHAEVVLCGTVLEICELAELEGNTWLRLSDGRGWVRQESTSGTNVTELIYDDVEDKFVDLNVTVTPDCVDIQTYATPYMSSPTPWKAKAEEQVAVSSYVHMRLPSGEWVYSFFIQSTSDPVLFGWIPATLSNGAHTLVDQ